MTSAVEIANAYVALSVKMPGVQKDIAKSLGAPEVETAVGKAGEGIGSRLMGGLQTIGKVGAVAAGGAIAAALGTALVKGFDRMKAIDQAEAKLSGLGHSAEGVEKIMNNALASVKGTAFGMGDAATVAASVVAAGVKPGQDLERTLKLVGDAATIAGTDMSTMGSIVNKVATSDMMQMDVANQLMDAGIPILQLLAAEMGVTADEAREMASAGEVSFETFQSALESGLGGAALKSGETFQGAMDNVMASLGRVGENILKGIFPDMKDGLLGLQDALGPVEDAAKDVGIAIGEFIGWIKDNSSWLGPLAAGIGIAVAAIIAWTAAQWLLNAALTANPIGLIVVGIGLLIGAVILLAQNWDTVMAAIGDALTWLYENTLKPVFSAIGAIFTWIWETIIKPVVDGVVIYFRIWAAIAMWLWNNALKPVFDAIGALITWLWENAFKPALDSIGAAFTWLYENIIKPVWDGIRSAIDTAWKWIDKNIFTPFKKGIDAIGTAFDAVGKFIGEVWTNIQNAAKEPVRFLIDTVWNNGLRSFAVDVLNALGLGDLAKGLKPIRLPFASGGVLPGYTPGRDVHEFYSPTGGRLALSGGEAIMRPEFTRAVGGPAGVDRLNRMARNGQAFADGGVVGFFGDVWDNIQNVASVAWEFFTDPVGAVKKHMGSFIDGLGGNGVFSDIIAGVPKMLLRGFEQFFESNAPKAVGGEGMGWQAMSQVITNAIPGARITSGYRPSSRTVNGGQSYHALGRAVDVVPATMDTFNRMLAMFPNARELIFSPAGRRQLLNGKPFNGWTPAVRAQHWDHVHLAMAQGGVVPKLYDQGGWLPHGGVAVNLSGRPERVLSPAESRTYTEGGLRPGDRVIFEVEGQPFTAIAKRVVAAELPSRQAVHSRFA